MNPADRKYCAAMFLKAQRAGNSLAQPNGLGSKSANFRALKGRDNAGDLHINPTRISHRTIHGTFSAAGDIRPETLIPDGVEADCEYRR
jgi:hypothetical protein